VAANPSTHAPAGEAPRQAHEDDLVRDVRFRPSAAGVAARDGDGQAELVDPFARRRSRRVADVGP
jgi:hypothetical protein